MIHSRVKPGYLLAIVVLLALIRFLPHPPNAVPIAAMALFAGAYFPNRFLAYVVPLTAMLISDWLIEFHNTMFYVYSGIAITVLIGSGIRQVTVTNVGIAASTATLVFFLVTNFGAWSHHDMYTQNLQGLLQAYTAGLPFLRNSVIANLVFSYLVFFGLDHLQAVKQLKKA